MNIHLDHDTPRHAACGVAFDELNIVVIEPSRSMQTIVRSMLQPLRPRRLRTYDTATDALRDMLIEPPNLVMTDWKMEPMSGLRLLKVMRHTSMTPLCFVPVIVITGNATRSSVESAFRAGAHAVMVKPFAPAAMRRRLEWIVQDQREFTLQGETWVVDGVAEVLDQQRDKERLPAIVAELRAGENASEDARPGSEDAQSIVDKIVAGELIDGDLPEAAIAKRSRKLREGRSEVSPTLDRLIRQRAQERRDPAPAKPQTPSPSKTITVKTKSKTRWQQLWGGGS